MYRSGLRTASRQALSSLRTPACRSAPRRLASTASPADRPSSWKGSALRWGLAVAAVYYYNTSTVFADNFEAQEPLTRTAPSSFAESGTPTVESVVDKQRQELETKTKGLNTASETRVAESATLESQPSTETQTDAATASSEEDLEEDAPREAAFNPETGEINWDCPCLGGMAHGPCGEEFKAAFSCFVYSTDEPKGMDCIDKFQGMQECFRKYPDHYGAELTDDDDEVAEGQALESDAPSAVQGQAFEEHQAEAPEQHQAEAPEQHKASAEESGLKVVEQSVADDGASKPSEIAVGAGNKDA
ncbi:Oxidoreductase [Claviceps purpurea]|nr:Oxidoreductase [Claviceps purpurea]